MMKIALALVIIVLPHYQITPSDGWKVFSSVRFTPRKIGEHEYLVPFFHSSVRELEGREIVLRGYHIPMDLVDRHTIIVSKVPNSSCFFCGGAGPETVAEIQLVKKPGKLKADQPVEVKGLLKLNDSDVNHMNFIITNAEVTLLKSL